MTKVTIEFSDVSAESAASVLAILNGGKAPAKKKAAAVKEEEPEEEPEDEDLTGEEEEVVELQTVREAAQKLIAAGKSAKLKDILKTFKSPKVIDLKKEDYAAALKAMQAVK